jgi:hypothetical protein
LQADETLTKKKLFRLQPFFAEQGHNGNNLQLTIDFPVKLTGFFFALRRKFPFF